MKIPTAQFLHPSKTMLALYVTVAIAIAAIVAGSIMYAKAYSDNHTLYSKLTAMTSDDHEAHTNLASASKERDSLQADENKIADREGAVKVREDAVAAKEAAVKKREDAVTATETHIQETTLVDGRVYTVGTTMQGGTYQANSTSARCYWKITTSGTNYEDIVQNDLGTQGVLNVTVGAGQDFQSSNCGNWTKIG
ncbi:MAG TPA: hypothetical protein VN045_08725 [Microbacteriaceae bacterium]|jgi:hypothetical protein|nr:hypothetical protein [Microbacteriaceae bacterium]